MNKFLMRDQGIFSYLNYDYHYYQFLITKYYVLGILCRDVHTAIFKFSSLNVLTLVPTLMAFCLYLLIKHNFVNSDLVQSRSSLGIPV